MNNDFQNNPQNNAPSAKSGVKKVLIGITIVVLAVLVILVIFWAQQSRQTSTITGTVSNVSMEANNLVVRQINITENSNGSLERNESFYTITWDDETSFTPEDVESKNEIFSPLATLEINTKRQLTSNSVLAGAIKLIEKAPYRE